MKERTDEHADTKRGAINPGDTETEIDTLNSFVTWEKKCRIQLAVFETV